jgi:exodeoxyribonuclease VII small subunit
VTDLTDEPPVTDETETGRIATDDTATDRSASSVTEPAARPIADLSFDDALAELQRVVAELETGGLPIERSITLYERGVGLHERCASLLSDAELRVQQLVARAGGVLRVSDVGPGDEANPD